MNLLFQQEAIKRHKYEDLVYAFQQEAHASHR